tara:strand:- start:1219 stop:1818 length:600 start_codon:yes stop_codon:yes gene_type:complete
LSVLKEILLASKSPRRRDLLGKLFHNFQVVKIECDEDFPSSMEILSVAEYLAEKKSRSYQNLQDNQILITADTTVILGDTIFNKPSTKEEGRHMLSSIMNNTHSVVTGVCLRDRNNCIHFSEITEVEMNPLTKGEIDYYLDNFKFSDKAGSYGIQDWLGFVAVKQIRGDYYNVMGLPLNKIYHSFRLNWPTYSFFLTHL